MKILLFENFITESLGKQSITVYHGSRTEHDFQSGGAWGGTYASEDYLTARRYGGSDGIVYKLELNLRLLDANKEADAQLILDSFGTLRDPYNECGNDDDEDDDGEEKEEPKAIIETAAELAYHNDSWEIIECNYGVLDWIEKQGYDGVCMCEGGGITYYIFDIKNNIVNYERCYEDDKDYTAVV